MANTASTTAVKSATAKTRKRLFLITQEELDQFYEWEYALRGIIELAGPTGETRTVNCKSLAAMLAPIAKGLSDIFCAAGDREYTKGGAR